MNIVDARIIDPWSSWMTLYRVRVAESAIHADTALTLLVARFRVAH